MNKKCVGAAAWTAVCVLAVCGADAAYAKEQKAESLVPEVSMDDQSLEGILTGINEDFIVTVSYLEDALTQVNNEIGETYEEYAKNKQQLTDWYALAETQSQLLFERTKENSVTYYKLIAETVDHDDYDAWDDALDQYYDEVYDGAFDDYYDAVYDDLMGEVYDVYYDGILDKAYDSVGYEEWTAAMSECYEAWSNGSSCVYKGWSDGSLDIYRLWSAVSSGFYQKNFDIDAIVAQYEEEKQKEAAKSIESEDAAQTEELPTEQEEEESDRAAADTADGVDPALKEFLDEYEAFMDQYIAFMEKYLSGSSEDLAGMLSDYGKMMGDYADYVEKFESYNPDEMSIADAAYYLEVSGRISQKLLKVAE